MANANFKLARRHAHFISQAGYWDGSVRLAHEIEATLADPKRPR